MYSNPDHISSPTECDDSGEDDRYLPTSQQAGYIGELSANAQGACLTKEVGTDTASSNVEGAGDDEKDPALSIPGNSDKTTFSRKDLEGPTQTFWRLSQADDGDEYENSGVDASNEDEDQTKQTEDTQDKSSSRVTSSIDFASWLEMQKTAEREMDDSKPEDGAIASNPFSRSADQTSSIHKTSVISFDNWIQTVGVLAPEEPHDSKVPDQLQKLLVSLCRKEKVISPSWYFTFGSDKKLIITGDGIMKVRQEITDQFPPSSLDFNVDFIHSGEVTVMLGGNVEGGSCNDEIPYACDLLLSASSHGNAPQPAVSHYAVTPMHIFMERMKMSSLDTGQLPTDAQEKLIDEVQQQFRPPTLSGRLGHPSALHTELQGRPMIAYRTHRQNPNFHYGKRDFMTDIALLQISPDASRQIENNVYMNSTCNFNGIVEISTKQQIRQMLNVSLHAGNRTVRVIDMRPSHPDWEIGYQISFIVIAGNEFVRGDSGTVIYSHQTSSEGTSSRHAIGMLKGRRPGTGPEYNIQGQYEAIVLFQALQEIGLRENIYDIRVFPLRPSQPGQAQLQ